MEKAVKEALLQLPSPEDKVVIEKIDFASKPDTSTLTEDQHIIFDKTIEAVTAEESSITLIRGYAGVGKTYLVNTITEHILACTSLKVAVTAPTNKAVKILKDKSRYSNKVINLRYSTIHSLLGLREAIDNRTGKQIFIRQKETDLKVDQYNVIFLDEGSMLPDKLWNDLVPFLSMYNIKLIVVGDPVQIPPIGSLDSIPFTAKGVKAHSIEVFSMTKILRQAEGNPIIALTMKIRKAIGRDNVLPVRESAYDENHNGVYFISVADKKFFWKMVHTYFNSENFKKDADFVKVIGWTNDCIDAFNTKIRSMIYGKDCAKLCIGEKLIADRPIKSPLDESSILFSTNDEFEVISFTEDVGKYKGVEMKYYTAVVLGHDGEKTIRVIHEDSEADYKLLLDYFIRTAKELPKGTWEYVSAWKDYYGCREVFGEVKYNYAITAHKAQGSTYENTIVVEEDINRNYKIVERNRIKYTAFTRPSNKLFILD